MVCSLVIRRMTGAYDSSAATAITFSRSYFHADTFRAIHSSPLLHRFVVSQLTVPVREFFAEALLNPGGLSGRNGARPTKGIDLSLTTMAAGNSFLLIRRRRPVSCQPNIRSDILRLQQGSPFIVEMPIRTNFEATPLWGTWVATLCIARPSKQTRLFTAQLERIKAKKSSRQRTTGFAR